MTIRLATARRSSNLYVAHRMAVPCFATPANDNRRLGASPAQLRAALLHFADHGLSAAESARQAAQAAHARGDRRDFIHWLEICRTLDMRKAATLEALDY